MSTAASNDTNSPPLPHPCTVVWFALLRFGRTVARSMLPLLVWCGLAAAGGTFVLGCQGSRPAGYAVGGPVTGLTAGSAVLQLLNQDGNVISEVTVSAPATHYTFPILLADGTYIGGVVVATQPTDLLCTVSNGGSGMIYHEAASVPLNCTGTFAVGGTVTGLTSGTLDLQLWDPTGRVLAGASVTAPMSSYVFSDLLAIGAGFSVQIYLQPVGLICAVTSGSPGVIGGGPASVPISCYPSGGPFEVGGTITGLTAGTLELQLTDSTGHVLGGAMVTAPVSTYVFSIPLAIGAGFRVQLYQQPVGLTCTVTSGSPGVIGAAPPSVPINCAPNTAGGSFTVGGSVSGLATGASLVLQDNGGNNLTVSANGSFTFTAPVASGAKYAVTVLTQPAGATCSIANGSGTIAAANITTVAVTCVPQTYTVGGTVSGLTTGTSVVLQNNGANSLTVSANGSFTFATGLPSGSTYAVTVATQPTGLTCAVANGSGSIASANVTTVAVTCSAAATTVLGVVTNTAAVGTAGSAGPGGYTSTISLYNLANKASPALIGTLTNAGNVLAIAIDGSSNVYYLANTGSPGSPGTFFACPAPAGGGSYACAQRGTTGAIGEAQWLAVDNQGNAYATQFASGGTGVVKFPVAAGPIPGTATGNMTLVYTSAAPPAQYYGLAVSADGASALYVSEGPGNFNYGLGVSVHACSIPCGTAGGTDVTQALKNASGQTFINLSGALAVGPSNSVYVGIGNAAGNTTGFPNDPVAFVCSVSGAVATATYTCAAGIQSYPLAEGISTFAQTAAIAADPGGNMYLGVDLATYGDTTANPAPAFLGFLAPSGSATLTSFTISGPQGPAVTSNGLYSEPPYAIAITLP